MTGTQIRDFILFWLDLVFCRSGKWKKTMS